METIIIEAVSDKFKNKFSNGSVLAGGKWLQVSSKVPLNLFQKDSEISVELLTNAKGYTSIVGVGQTETPVEETKPATKRATVKKETTTAPKSSYEDDKNSRIQVQGLIQAAIQSPATINFGDDVNTIAEKVLALTDLLIDGMNKRV